MDLTFLNGYVKFCIMNSILHLGPQNQNMYSFGVCRKSLPTLSQVAMREGGTDFEEQRLSCEIYVSSHAFT